MPRLGLALRFLPQPEEYALACRLPEVAMPCGREHGLLLVLCSADSLSARRRGRRRRRAADRRDGDRRAARSDFGYQAKKRDSDHAKSRRPESELRGPAPLGKGLSRVDAWPRRSEDPLSRADSRSRRTDEPTRWICRDPTPFWGFKGPRSGPVSAASSGSPSRSPRPSWAKSHLTEYSARIRMRQ